MPWLRSARLTASCPTSRKPTCLLRWSPTSFANRIIRKPITQHKEPVMPRWYKIVRFFQRDDKRPKVIKRRLTLEEAQRHCAEPETSSQTCTSNKRRAYTRLHGPWFDGYQEDR